MLHARTYALALLLLLLALPALPATLPSKGGQPALQAAGHTGAPAGSPPPLEASQDDEVLLEKLFDKSGRYYLAMPIFRLSNGSLETYIVAVKYGSSVYINVFDTNGDTVYTTTIGGCRVNALFPGGLEKVYLPVYNCYYLYAITSSPWNRVSYNINSFAKHALVTPNGTYLVTATSSELRVYSVDESGPLLLFSENHGLYYYSPNYYYFHPASKQGSTLVQVLSNHRGSGDEKTKIWVAWADLEAGTLSMDSYDIGNATEVFYATLYMAPLDIRYADIAYPWLAGLSPKSGKLYLVDLAEETLETLDLWSLLGTELDSPWLTAVWTEGEPRFIIAGVDSSGGTPGVPLVAVFDPETGAVEDVYRLEGFPTMGLKAELAPYGGVEALYLLVHHYIVILDAATMSVIAAVETNISKPQAIAYGEHNGVAILVASGYNENDQELTEFYSIGGIAEVARTTLEAPDQAYTGEPFAVDVTLVDYKGDPIPGKTVVVEELTGESWTPIASGVTDSEGRATITLTLTGRGEHLLRAHYAGGDGYTAAYSRPARVLLYEKVHLTITVEPSTTIEGVPASAVVLVERASGAPLGGVWVRVLANVSGTWAVVGAGLTGDNGLAVVPVSLYAGTYMLVPEVVTPYLEVTWNNSAILRVVTPLTPPPEGPYVAPVGRVLAFAPPMAEKGQEAAVVFAFYYGENVLQPESVEVSISPEEPYTLEQVEPGVYRVVFTPGQTGVYTVVFRAEFNGAAYVGAASFYVYNVMERVSTWEAQIMAVLEDLLELNETLTSYLESINESLARLNMSRLQAMVEMIGENTSLILLRLEALNASLENSTSTVISTIQGDLENATGTLQAMILANWMEIRGLNETFQSVAERLNASIESVRVLVASNGEVLAVINTSIGDLARALEKANATIVAEIRATANKTYYLVNTSTGILLASLDTLRALLEETGYKLELVNSTTVEVRSALGVLNASLQTALEELGLIKGELQGLQDSVEGVRALVRAANGTLASILLETLKPRIESVSGEVALLNTSMGYLIANLTLARQAIATLQDSLDKANTKLDAIQQALDQLGTKLEQAPTKESVDQATEKAGRAQTLAIAGVGTGLAGLGLAALSLVRRP